MTGRAGSWVDTQSGSLYFKDWAGDWLASKQDLRPTSRSHYRSILKNHLYPTFGATPLRQISPTQVRLWYSALSQSKPSVADAAYRVLRAILSTAVQEGVLTENPCRLQGAGLDRAPERPVPSVDQVHEITRRMPENLRLAVHLAAWGTLRLGEVLALERSDIDLATGAVTVSKTLSEQGSRVNGVQYGPPKSDAGFRVVHLPEATRMVMAHHMEHFVGLDSDSPVFTGPTGNRLWQKAVRRPFRVASEAIGLPALHFHDLRHFAATVAAQAGATTKELMARGGWASVTMVVRYQHQSPERDQAIAKNLDSLASKEEASRPYAPGLSFDGTETEGKSASTSMDGGPPGSRSRHLGIKSPLLFRMS